MPIAVTNALIRESGTGASLTATVTSSRQMEPAVADANVRYLVDCPPLRPIPVKIRRQRLPAAAKRLRLGTYGT